MSHIRTVTYIKGLGMKDQESFWSNILCEMMQSAVLALVAVWLFSATSARRISTRSVLDNEIDLDTSSASTDRSWVTLKATENEVKALFGEIVELECEASGSPAPIIQFYRDPADLAKNEIFSNEIGDFQSTGLGKAKGRLRFVAKKTEVIFCKATSGRKSAHAAIRVFVSGSKLNLLGNDIWNYKSKEDGKHRSPRITFFDTMYLDNIGNTVTLPCTASGDIDTIWLNASDSLVADGTDKRFTITPFGDLKIRNIRWTDMGPYTCIARNSHGQDSITTFLYPMLPEK